MQLSHSPQQSQEKSEEYKILVVKIQDLGGNLLVIKRLDEWRAKLFQLCLKRLSYELEGEEDHGTSYSMMRLNNFFSTQLKITQISDALPHSEDSTYGISGLGELIAIQEEITNIANHEERFQLDEMLVSLFQNINTAKTLESYSTVAKKALEPRKISPQEIDETQSGLKRFKDKLLSLVRSI